MTYISGTASSVDELKTALENACVTAGWVLTSGILSKDGMYIQISGTLQMLTLRGGTGQTATVLDGEPQISSTKVGVRLINYLGTKWTYPINYEIHTFTNPDEVYFIINYNTDYYQQLSFGKSTVPGIGGTGLWFTGSYSTQLTESDCGVLASFYTSIDDCGVNNGTMGCGNFFGTILAYPTHFVHNALDTTGWHYDGAGTVGYLMPASWAAGLMTSLPSNANYSNVMVPCKGVQERNNFGQTIVVNPNNLRWLRIDYINPGSNITFGAEEWRIYPFYRKSTVDRNGKYVNDGSAEHSGTWGYAIRYTGP